MIKIEQLQFNFEELMMEKANEVPEGEEVSIDFFNVKSFNNQTIKSCQGGLLLLVRCIKAEDRSNKIQVGNQYIVTRDILGLGMWYMLKGLEGEAAYPVSWFEIVDKNYIEPVKDDIREQEQLRLY